MVTIVTVEEYRELLDDYKSTDEQIKSRLKYLEAFCRNVIKLELEKHVGHNTSN
ncbi:MAG: hypothetical protein HQ530_03730 [Parcubacteria group bacterium]|nr:hypothetical protein [Parcubacteria group bacterium]